MISVLLIDPKYPHNVGGALRACACFGGDALRWTGNRVPPPDAWPQGARLPREERMRINKKVDWGHLDASRKISVGTPVAVERRPAAESLPDFVHPDDALYVFGPEDGNVPGEWLARCHRFVRIPTANDGPLNLAAAVNVVLYDRLTKSL